MARPLRIEFPGALYHVTARGNARAAIFFGDPDRHSFLGILGEVVTRFQWLCHAYCLMTNHYHLLLETPDANLSRGMRRLNGIYTQRFNRRHDRVGHLLQGRFKGILVERETHLLELARYVVLNPVRAGLVTAAENYVWSSLRATLGIEASPSWLRHDALLASFGTPQRYQEFVREGVGGVSPWDHLRGPLLGSPGFGRSLGERLREKASQAEIPRRERLAFRGHLRELFPPELRHDRRRRDQRIKEVCRSGHYTFAEIGRQLGLHYSTVWRIAAGGRGRRRDAQIQDLTP